MATWWHDQSSNTLSNLVSSKYLFLVQKTENRLRRNFFSLQAALEMEPSYTQFDVEKYVVIILPIIGIF